MTTFFRETPLHCAVSVGLLNVVEHLLFFTEDMTAYESVGKSNSPLFTAMISCKDIRVLEVLLLFDEKMLETSSVDQITPFEWVIARNNDNIVELFLSCNAVLHTSYLTIHLPRIQNKTMQLLRDAWNKSVRIDSKHIVFLLPFDRMQNEKRLN